MNLDEKLRQKIEKERKKYDFKVIKANLNQGEEQIYLSKA